MACETYAKSNMVVVGGEITTKAKLDFNAIAREAIREIGYTHDDDVFHADKVFIMNAITSQSPDIAQGVDAAEAEGKETAEQGAGDQGLMFGYACNETPELMPAPIMFAHRLGPRTDPIRKSGKVKWLRPDAKSQVSVQYVNDKPVRITNVVISTQHAADVEAQDDQGFLHRGNHQESPARRTCSTKNTKFLINPTGRFVVGGPQGDTGLTGRKIIVDSYGGMGRHGGGAFSRQRPVARSIAARLTWAVMWPRTSWPPASPRSAEIQFAYAIGYPDPVSRVRQHLRHRHGSAMKTSSARSAKCSASSRRTSSSNSTCSARFIRKTTNYGHFGKDDDLEASPGKRPTKPRRSRKRVEVT